MRIVSLAPSNTEILYALGCQDLIVAVTRFCDYPNDAKLKPKIGGWLDIDDELVEKLNPDLIMTSTFVQDSIVKRYKEKNIELFHTDPKKLLEVYESIISIGKKVNKIDEAEQIVANMKKEFLEINNSVKDKSKVKVYCEEFHNPPTFSGNWVPDIVEIANGKSLCPSGKISSPITIEDIKEFDPEVIIMNICGLGEKVNPELITKRSGWQDISAIKKNKVFVIDDSLLNRPGPRLVDGAKLLSKLIHD